MRNEHHIEEGADQQELSTGEFLIYILAGLLFIYLTYRGFKWLLKPATKGAAEAMVTPIAKTSASVTDIMKLLHH